MLKMVFCPSVHFQRIDITRENINDYGRWIGPLSG